MSSVIVPLLSGVGLGRYTGYIDGRISFSINQLIYQIPFLIVLFIERKRILVIHNHIDNNHNIKMFLVCLFFVNVVLSQLATVMENSWRVMLLFGMFNIVTFSYLYNVEKNKAKKYTIFILLFAYLVYYWFFTFVITGRHATVPYLIGLE